MWRYTPGVTLLLMLSSQGVNAEPDRLLAGRATVAAQNGAPYSTAVQVGDTLYIAGHIGTDPTSNRVPEDPRAEAKALMDGFRATVGAAGFSMDDLVFVQVYCTDLALYDSFNAVYRTYFHDTFPARAFLGTNALLRDAHFEVLGIAIRRSH